VALERRKKEEVALEVERLALEEVERAAREGEIRRLAEQREEIRKAFSVRVRVRLATRGDMMWLITQP